MNKIFRHFSRFAASSLWAFLFGFCLVYVSLSGVASASGVAAGDSSNWLRFNPAADYDEGKETSIAAHTSGLVVEFHKSGNNSGIWYRVGKLDSTNVMWGGSQFAGVNGSWPTVAISKEGYVVAVHSTNSSKNGSFLHYRVGKIDPYGSQNQSITWLTGSIEWDAGFHSSIAINDRGVIVGVHETGHASTGLYYRVGRFTNPAAGAYTIHWDSGVYGIQYDNGINPHIAINNENEVVEVHQVSNQSRLHYRRGTLSGGTIQFTESKRYEDDGYQPAIALFDTGQVVEVHVADYVLHTRFGRLSTTDSGTIWWDSSVTVTGAGSKTTEYPALAGTGRSVIATFWMDRILAAKLRCAVGEISPQLANNTLVKGSSANVYVVLNNHRHWIPDETTFVAMGYNWGKILWISDDELNVFPERSPFPSVAPQSGPLRYANGTLVRGSGTKVYVVLNNYRFWIPDEATFVALGYKWGNIRSLPDYIVHGIPEGGLFPSVAQ